MNVISYERMANRGYEDIDRAIVYYAGRGEINKIQYLTTNHYDDCKFAFDEALREAALHGHIDVVDFFMKQGCDVKAFDCACLKKAVLSEKFDMIRFLLSKGCSLSTALGHNTSDIKNIKDPELKRFLLRLIKMERVKL